MKVLIFLLLLLTISCTSSDKKRSIASLKGEAKYLDCFISTDASDGFKTFSNEDLQYKNLDGFEGFSQIIDIKGRDLKFVVSLRYPRPDSVGVLRITNSLSDKVDKDTFLVEKIMSIKSDYEKLRIIYNNVTYIASCERRF